MRDEDHPRPRRDAALDRIVDLLQTLRRRRILHLLQHDLLAELALPDRRDHARIILRGRQDLIAGLQVEAEETVLQCLRCIAHDRDLFGVAAEDPGESGTHVLTLRLEQLPHRVRGDVLLLPGVPDERFRDDARRRRDAAVVQVDDAARAAERALDLEPEILIRCGAPPGAGLRRGRSLPATPDTIPPRSMRQVWQVRSPFRPRNEFSAVVDRGGDTDGRCIMGYLSLRC